MEAKERFEDAESPLASITWTIEKCSDIKRSLSGRAANARREKQLSERELAEMARLYMTVDHVERYLRDVHGAADASPFPEWVLKHVTLR